MSGGLVSAWVQAEVKHERSLVLGGDQVGATESGRQVITVEGRLVLGEDLDTVSLKLQSVDGLSRLRIHDGVTRNGRGELLVLDGHCIERNTIIGHDLTLRHGRAVELLVGQEGQSVPVAVLVRVGRGDVLGGAQTHEHGLNGPLELRQQNIVGALRHAGKLEAMHADQRKSTIIPGFRMLCREITYRLNIYIMNKAFALHSHITILLVITLSSGFRLYLKFIQRVDEPISI